MPKPPETADRSDTVPEPNAPLLAFVMIAAPDPDFRLYVRRGLDGLEAEIMEAADGLEALQRLAGRQVDLVIADTDMPRLDGWELSRVMAGRGVPALLMGALSPGLAPGATVPAQPFDRPELRAAVRKAVAGR